MPIDKDKVKVKGTTHGLDIGGKATNTLWKPKSLQDINETISSPRADHLGGARRVPPDPVTGRTAPGEVSKIMGGFANARRR